MICRKSEQNSETMMEFMKEKMMFSSWTAFYYFMSFLARATMRKSRVRRKKMRRVYWKRVRQMVVLFEPMFAKMMSSGSGALPIIILDLGFSNN
jgi:hypothetical protein